MKTFASNWLEAKEKDHAHGKKPLIKTVVFIEVRVTQRTSLLLLEGIKSALATVSVELSRAGEIKNLMIVLN